MPCDALRRGRHSLNHQVYCITTVTRGRYPLFTDITAARLLEIARYIVANPLQADLVRNIGDYPH